MGSITESTKNKAISQESNSRLRDILKKIDNYLLGSQLEFNAEKLINFCKKALESREKSKFYFSKSISNYLKYIEALGVEIGINRSEIAFLSFNDLDNLNIDHTNQLIAKAKQNKVLYEITKKIQLPHLIINSLDIELIKILELEPNYVTSVIVTGRIELLSNTSNFNTLEDKIVLIENADPGYDWIFSKNIKGLITKYGGAGSHMALRCSELNIPAAIGCGEMLFDRILQSNNIILNCEQNVINILN